MQILDTVIGLLFLFMIGAFPFLVVNVLRYLYGRKPDKRFPVKSAACFVAPVVCLCILTPVFTSIARRQVLEFINEGKQREDVIVKIGNTVVTQPDRYLIELAKLRFARQHQSHPDTTIAVEIKCGDRSVTLELARDSRNKNEYWIFWPEYSTTSDQAIGRVRTEIFADL
jgi:hypothetical protein